MITVSEKQEAWAQEVGRALEAGGFRFDLDLSSDKLGAKIRRAQLEKIPYMLVCGDREVEERKVAPRKNDGTRMEA